MVTIEEAKQHLRIEHDEDDIYIENLIRASEQFLKNATGKTFSNANALAKTVCLLLVADLYEKREIATEKAGEKVRNIVNMIITQLALSGDE